LVESALLLLNTTGVSKVPHQWLTDPTHVGPMSQTIFLQQIFSDFLKLNPTDFYMWIEGQMIGVYAKFSRFAR